MIEFTIINFVMMIVGIVIISMIVGMALGIITVLTVLARQTQ